MKAAENTLQHEALVKIREFMQEMKEWESEYCEKSQNIEILDNENIILNYDEVKALENEYLQRLKKILDKHVLDIGKNYDRFKSLSAQWPTTYDFDTDKVESAEGTSRKFVYTYQRTAGFEEHERLTLQKKEGQWFLRKRETLINGKWWTVEF